MQFCSNRFITIKYNYKFINYLKNSLFLNELKADNDMEAIKILSDLVAKDSGISKDMISSKVIAREELMPTGIGNGVAIPHARIDGITKPIIAVGISEWESILGAEMGCCLI